MAQIPASLKASKPKYIEHLQCPVSERYGSTAPTIFDFERRKATSGKSAVLYVHCRCRWCGTEKWTNYHHLKRGGVLNCKCRDHVKKRSDTVCQILKLVSENSNYTLQQIADIVGVSRQRVHQVLRRYLVKKPSSRMATAELYDENMMLKVFIASNGLEVPEFAKGGQT